jgi:hypothetical protein
MELLLALFSAATFAAGEMPVSMELVSVLFSAGRFVAGELETHGCTASG